MHLREGEVILKIVKRHPTPFIFNAVLAAIVVAPIYFVIYIIAKNFGTDVLIGSLSIFTFVVIIGFFIGSLDYILDKLVVTNIRVVNIDWKSLLKKVEEELELKDIQNVKTSELGILSRLRILRFGKLEVESSASRTSIIFHHCNDPVMVKHLMLSRLTHIENHLPGDTA